MKIKFLGMSIFLMSIAFLNYAMGEEPNLAPSETVELRADLQISKCDLINDLNLCSVLFIPFENVKVVLTKQDTLPSENYEQWQGSWQDVKNEEGIDFVAHLLITKYRIYNDNGHYDYYNVEAGVGTPLLNTKTKILINNIDSIEELNSITIVGEPIYKDNGKTILTPHFHLGRKHPDLISP